VVICLPLCFVPCRAMGLQGPLRPQFDGVLDRRSSGWPAEGPPVGQQIGWIGGSRHPMFRH
jgi:hypothetical protein